MRHKDLTGKRFGRLVVLRDTGIRKQRGIHSEHLYLCKCDCGQYRNVLGADLRTVRSCGCLRKEGSRHIHDLSHTRIDNIYKAMKARCYNPNTMLYSRYGWRGIRMCDEWLSDKQNFFDWAFSHGYNDELTIDRIDNDKGYDPSNCRWTTRKVQANNTSRNHYITFDGETHTLTEWSEITGIKRKTLEYRLKHGWSIEESLFLPAKEVTV